MNDSKLKFEDKEEEPKQVVQPVQQSPVVASTENKPVGMGIGASNIPMTPSIINPTSIQTTELNTHTLSEQEIETLLDTI